MKSKASLFLVFGTAAAMLLVNGCKTEEDYKQERIQKAAEQFDAARKRDLASDRMLTLHDCIGLAMKNNLDVKVQNMERDAAKNVMWAEILGMLPDLSVTDNFTTRSNQPGSRSKSIESDGESYGYSTSQDRNINNLSVDMAFSLLDFGLAFFNSQQSHDRVLLKQRQIQRMRQNLTMDVVRAYFKVAAAQRAVDITGNLLKQCKDRTALIDTLLKQKKITPFRAFEENNRFLTMEKRLTNYTRTYENACVELRALLGVYPSVNIIVDDSVLDKMPSFDLPEIELLEQMAILKRPELYEIDIQRHINILECRKTILMMLPNVQLYMDFVNNNNSFLYHQTWWEMAVRAAYNALKTPQHLARYMAYSDQADIEKLRSFAQAITVMSQVRIAKADIASSMERYEINRKEHRNYSEHLKKAESIKRVQGSLSQLELDHLRLTTAETEIERLLALGSCYIAHYRLLNAIGVDNLDPATQTALKAELEQGRKRAEAELALARAEYVKQMEDAENARIARILFEDGLKYYNQKNPRAASEYFKRSAEKGSATAMFCLGKLYWTGKGVEQNRQTAFGYFKKAADAGNPEAMSTVGWLYYTGDVVRQSYSSAAEYYLKAAENGRDRAYYWLGEISCKQGKYDQGMAYFKKAARAEEADATAMVRIGNLYFEGNCSEGKNFAKAREWFKRAQSKGDASAKECLAMLDVAEGK